MIANVLDLDQRGFLRRFAWMRRSFLPGSGELVLGETRRPRERGLSEGGDAVYRKSARKMDRFWVTAGGGA